MIGRARLGGSRGGSVNRDRFVFYEWWILCALALALLIVGAAIEGQCVCR